MDLTDVMTKIATTDIFSRDSKTAEPKTGIFVGHPFHLDYDRAHLLVNDSWKFTAHGIPQGSFLLHPAV